MNEVENQLSSEVANLSPARRTVPRRTFLCRMGLGAVALVPGAALFSSASNAFGEEEAKSQGEVAIQTILRPWRLLRMKWETISMTTPMMRSLTTGF
jgi:hypothetical protein